MKNDLAKLFDRFCSDKGTFWQSRHHYANAYDVILGPRRSSVRSVVEVGIGEDTAPSVASWLKYFPNAHVFPIDIKDPTEFFDRARPGDATDRLVKYQAQFGCEYDRNMWRNPRVHLTLGTDASQEDELSRVHLPALVDVIIDDGSHAVRDQVATLRTLWPRLAAGGIYIVEDLLVGALPWRKDHARDAPSNNTNCGGECFFPQRVAEHPLLFDRFSQLRRPPEVTRPVEDILAENDWFWTITGVHRGGGVDASLVIRKGGAAAAQSTWGAAGFDLPSFFIGTFLVLTLWWCRAATRDRHRYQPV